MRDFLYITKALADSNRLRALCALQEQELCVCQIIELLDLAPSTVSKHMSILRQARLVDSKKRGRWIFYRLDRENAPLEVKKALTWVLDSLALSDVIQKDAIHLKEILQIDPEVLCKK